MDPAANEMNDEDIKREFEQALDEAHGEDQPEDDPFKTDGQGKIPKPEGPLGMFEMDTPSDFDL